MNPHNFIKTQLLLDPAVKARMIDDILIQDFGTDYRRGYNWSIRDQHGDFANLYKQMLELAKKLFPPFTPSENNIGQCFAAVTSGNNFRSKMHAHLTMNCAVNIVYYLQMPKNITADEGGLELVENGKHFIFRPQENDLIFMPAWMEHKPLYHKSPEERIVVNMEIRSVEPVEHFFKPKLT